MVRLPAREEGDSNPGPSAFEPSAHRLLSHSIPSLVERIGDAGLLDARGPKGEPIVVHSINLALDSAPHTYPFEVIFPGTPAVQVAPVVFDEARTALLKPMQFRLFEDNLAVGSRDASDTFLGPRQIARGPSVLLVNLVKMPLGPSERALVLNEPARPGPPAGSCSLEWQLEDQGVGHREVKANAGLGRVGVEIDVGIKLSQPSPLRGREKPLLLSAKL